MTTHCLRPNDDIEAVTLGYDRPLGTYFAQVYRHDEVIPEVWRGIRERITDHWTVIEEVRPYAAIPEGLASVLYEDPYQADQNTVRTW